MDVLLIAFAVALVATPLAARLAIRFGVVDRPGPLKIQRSPVPYLGGVAVFLALAAGIAPHRPLLLAPLFLALALGVADDVADVAPRVRLACEVGIGLSAGLVVPAPGRIGVFVTAAFVIGLVNAVNLLDGLDGLASGVALVSALGLATLGGDAQVAGLALAGALGGFLVFNRPPARIYLGDGGAYLVGTTLAVCAALGIEERGTAAGWAAVPLLVAVPLTDTGVAIVRRMRARLPLFAGDRSHIYDQLVDRGRTRVQAVVACVALQVVLTALGVVAARLDSGVAFALSAGAVALLVVGAALGGFFSNAEPNDSARPTPKGAP